METYAKIALGLPIDELFDYIVPGRLVASCKAGSRVWVPFGGRNLLGYVAGLSNKTKIKKLKEISSVVDVNPILNNRFLQLTKDVSDYYCSSWGQAIESALPVGIRKGVAVRAACEDAKSEESMLPEVTLARHDDYGESLKFCLEEIDKTIKQNKQVIVAAAEMEAALNIFDLLSAKYPDKSRLTSRKQNPKEELKIWEEALLGSIDIIVGTRAAVFAPFQKLGLVIIAQEESYGHKEEQAPYYDCRQVAIMRGSIEGARVILTAKTPSLESYYQVKQQKYAFVDLRAKQRRMPAVKLVDMKQYGNFKQKKTRVFSVVLEDRINKALANNKRVLIFINRKGFARYAYCQKCGYSFNCERCSSKLVFYRDEKKLVCPACAAKIIAPGSCPACNSQYIIYAGMGIEKAASHLHLFFPQAEICRLDKEHITVSENAGIIVATEKAFHQAVSIRAWTVAVLDSDGILNTLNFRSNEKVFSLLYKLSLLAEDELIIQTSIPEYYSERRLNKFDSDDFYDFELEERKAMKLAPFVTLAYLNLRGKSENKLKSKADYLYELLKEADKKVTVFPPVEGMPYKMRGAWRLRILLKANDAYQISKLLKKQLKNYRHSGIIVTVEMDPQ